MNDYINETSYHIPIGVVPIVAPNYQNGTFLTTSMDWDVSDKDQVRGRYIYNRYSAIDTAAELPVFYTSLAIPFHLVTVAEYHTSRPILAMSSVWASTASQQSYTVPGGALGKFQNLDAFPNLTIDELGFLNVGPAPNNPQYAVENTYQLTDNFSWIKGNHTLKFGLDLRKQIDPQKFIQRSRGDYEWAGLDGFVNDFMPRLCPAQLWLGGLLGRRQDVWLVRERHLEGHSQPQPESWDCGMST